MKHKPDQTKTKNLSDLFVRPNSSIRDAILSLEKTKRGIALIVDDDDCLLGTITQAEMRMVILQRIDQEKPVSDLLDIKQKFSNNPPVTAPYGMKPADLIKRMREVNLQHLPILDSLGRVVDLVRIDDLVSEDPLPIRAVVMAGGFGKRLRPLTDKIPKPMLPIGDRPVMEHIIDQFRDAGIQQINITTHFMAEKIKHHFGNGSEFGVNIEYVSEDQPLGTAGALGLIEAFDKPLLVVNGDILSQVDYRAMLAFHHKHKADMTVGVRQFDFKIPYGVLECDGIDVQEVVEKPTYNFFVNTGIYLLEPSIKDYIPNGSKFDMTDLIKVLIEMKKTIISFPIVEYWLDIGQIEDYQKAQEDIENGLLKKEALKKNTDRN